MHKTEMAYIQQAYKKYLQRDQHQGFKNEQNHGPGTQEFCLR